MHHIVLWKWRQESALIPYTAEHVNTMCAMLSGNVPDATRIICVTDDPAGITECETFPLWKDHAKSQNLSGKHLPMCHRRLKLFDPETQGSLGIKRGHRVVSLDLDTLVCGPLHDVLATRERYVGWEVRGDKRPKVFNGSFWMFTAGDLQGLWTEFNAEAAARVKALGFMGSDQAWLSFNMIGKPYVRGFKWPTFASYPREIRRVHCLHKTTKLIFFHGRRKPWHPEVQRESKWIARYWRVGHV